MTSSIQLSPNDLRVEICSSSEEISPFVSAGSGPKVADQPDTTANISAHVAALQLIEHTNTQVDYSGSCQRQIDVNKKNKQIII